MWGLTLLSLAGVILNVHKRKEGFIVWAFTNLAWCVYDFKIEAYAQSVLFFVYFLLALWGLWKWWRDDKKKEV